MRKFDIYTREGEQSITIKKVENGNIDFSFKGKNYKSKIYYKDYFLFPLLKVNNNFLERNPETVDYISKCDKDFSLDLFSYTTEYERIMMEIHGII